MREEIYINFGARIKAFRKASNLTQGDVSDAIRISRPSLSNIEAGRQRIYLDQFYDLCSVLGVEPAEILDFKIKPNQQAPIISRLNARISFLEGHILDIRKLAIKPIYKTPSAIKGKPHDQ